MENILLPIKIENVVYIDGRGLYSLFDIGRDFPTWIRAKINQLDIKKHEYIEYSVKKAFAKKPHIEYNLSLAAAKKISESMKVNKNSIKLMQYISSLESNIDMATESNHIIKSIDEDIQMELTNENPCIDINDNMKIFNNDIFGELTILIDKNNTQLVKANDVLKALGYAEKGWSTTLKRKCRRLTKCKVPHPQNKNKEIEVNFIPEGDIYRLIVGSHLPEAEKFERWVFDDVLPSIRQNGLYATTSTIDKMLSDPDAAIKLLENYKKEREEKEKLLTEIKRNEPKVMAYDDFISCNELYSFASAIKILSIPRTATSNTYIGKNTLLAWLRRDGILMTTGSNRNIPYQQYFNSGYFELKAIESDDIKNIRATVMITPKGIEWLYKKYRYSNMQKKIIISSEDKCEDTYYL